MPEREGALAEEQIVRSIQSRDVRISVNTDTPIITCQSCDPVQIATRVCGPCDVFVFAVIPFLLFLFKSHFCWKTNALSWLMQRNFHMKTTLCRLNPRFLCVSFAWQSTGCPAYKSPVAVSSTWRVALGPGSIDQDNPTGLYESSCCKLIRTVAINRFHIATQCENVWEICAYTNMFYIHNIYSVYIYGTKKYISNEVSLRKLRSYRKWTFSILTNQRSLCPVGTCVKRSLSHIRICPKIIVSSWHLR